MQTVLAGLCLSLAGCEPQIPPWNAGKLVVAIPEIAQGPEAELERELARLLAERLHVTLETVELPQSEVLGALRKHQVHLAAAPLRSGNDFASLHFGPSYQSVRELVVCNGKKPPIKNFADLEGRELTAAAGSSQEVALREVQASLPTLQWQTLQNYSMQDMLAEIGEGTMDCAAANELQFVDARNYHPNLVAEFDIAPPSKLAWGFPDDADPALLEQVEIFFTGIRHDGTLNRLLERYYGHNNRLGRMDTTAFIAGINTVLPHFRLIFEDAASITGEDWRLLAALAYQESQWDPLATSFTNVRGIMMLTEDTADQMNVGNRLDADESIHAGAKYLQHLKAKMPKRIREPDRTWLALAAYNQGFSHLEDARILTKRAGLNPDSWSDVKKKMPLLNRPKYYNTLKHGYARGGEAVVLVESIRSYYDMLKRLKPGQPADAVDVVSYRLVGSLRRLLHYSHKK